MEEPLEVDKIILSALEIGEQLVEENANSGVIVKMKNGDTYSATFFTFQNFLEQLPTIENNVDMFYLWFKNLVLVRRLNESSVNAIVEQMIDEGDFQLIFTKLTA